VHTHSLDTEQSDLQVMNGSPLAGDSVRADETTAIAALTDADLEIVPASQETSGALNRAGTFG